MNKENNEDIAVSVCSISKSFKLPHEQHSGIKQLMINRLKGIKGYENQNVLKDVSFEIKKGEFFGVVGRNGSGKSTLLKVLAGIYSPDKGSVKVNGSLTPFIELGVGFNPELTGRENIFLNGALLGFDHQEVESMYSSIVDFAELGRFTDQKLKNYSSGMQVRLAFSIAIRAQSDVLILDEVLAVGDESFQKKCIQYFMDIKNTGKTVILVTHDMNSVERFCDRVLVINDGRAIGVYSPHRARNIYSKLNSFQNKNYINENNYKRWGSGRVKINSVEVDNKKSRKVHITQASQLNIVINLSKCVKEGVVVGLGFYDEKGIYMSGPNSFGNNITSSSKIKYRVDKFPLKSGVYTLEVAVFNSDLSEEYDHILNAKTIFVDPNKNVLEYGKVDLFGVWSKE